MVLNSGSRIISLVVGGLSFCVIFKKSYPEVLKMVYVFSKRLKVNLFTLSP